MGVIRGEILNSKTTQVSAHHQREVSSLGRIQEREVRSRDDLKRREQSFWREVARASGAGPGERRVGLQSNDKAPLERALEAHRLLKEAKDRHQGVAQELRVQISKVLRTKCAVDIFTKMQSKARAQSLSRRLERLGEQLEEVYIARLALNQNGAPAPLPQLSEIRTPATAPNPAAHVPLANAVSMQSIQCEADLKAPTLTVTVDQGGAPVSCRLSTVQTGQIGIVVGTTHTPLSDQIERGRSSLVAKLSEVGIKVSNIEVRRDLAVDQQAGGAHKRGRRTQEERDENTIS